MIWWLVHGMAHLKATGRPNEPAGHVPAPQFIATLPLPKRRDGRGAGARKGAGAQP